MEARPVTDARRPVVVCDLHGMGPVDLASVDALACLQLAAQRLGCELVVLGASSRLRELVAFAGLDQVLTLPAGGAEFVTEMVTNRHTDTFAAVVEALTLMATAPEGILSSERLADELGLNPVVVRRELAPMRAAGIVEARRGVGGGWAIARDPTKLRLGDIYRALTSSSAYPSGALGEALARADSAYVRELDTTTVADVSRWQRPTTPRGNL
jgi:DNA-binding IscR family transcriptional regulator